MTQAERITNLENQIAYLKGQIAVLMALRNQPYVAPISPAPIINPYPYSPTWCNTTLSDAFYS